MRLKVYDGYALYTLRLIKLSELIMLLIQLHNSRASQCQNRGKTQELHNKAATTNTTIKCV